MAGPKYPLQALLDQRERVKEDAKKAFAAALKAVDAAKARLAEIHAEREALVAERADREAHLYDADANGQLAIARIEERRLGLVHLGERIAAKAQEIEAQEGVVRAAEAAAEESKAALVAADQELKAIEKHRESWRLELKKEAERKEQRLSEEISSAQFVRDSAERNEDDDASRH